LPFLKVIAPARCSIAAATSAWPISLSLVGLAEQDQQHVQAALHVVGVAAVLAVLLPVAAAGLVEGQLGHLAELAHRGLVALLPLDVLGLPAVQDARRAVVALDRADDEVELPDAAPLGL
jgi:hypothetical protein